MPTTTRSASSVPPRLSLSTEGAAVGRAVWTRIASLRWSMPRTRCARIAKPPSEFIELQTAFLRKQMEKTVEQAKEFQVMTTKAAEDVSKPIKDVYEKAMEDLKVA